jgi:nicotinate phosphoribosyltransferase
MNTVEYGPLEEAGQLSGGLDYYKPTMSQVLHEKEPGVEDTFTFKNRGAERIADYVTVADLQARFDDIRDRGWQTAELEFLASLRNSQDERFFDDAYLEYLGQAELPAVQVRHDEASDDIAIETTGPAAMATFWETVVMSEVNEAYFEGYVRAHDIDLMEVYEEGDRRLSEKITILQANPDIKIVDFGTRRHFSLRWQRHVVERLATECPDNFVGTSNVALANSLGLTPIGTFAHELPMIYAGLADARGEDIRASHSHMLEDWYDRYGPDLSIALTDTFGTDFFFEDFTMEQAEKWRGTRHDSGDPVDYGERDIKFYEEQGIDPKTKKLVFSDGLDIHRIVDLHNHFKSRVNTEPFGWGTTLTNDLGLKALNVVMKVTSVRTADGREAATVKLSDDPGKHTGPPEKIKEYNHEFRALGATAIAA